MKILLIQLRQLGDILLTTPVMRELKRVAPGCSITFLAHDMGRLILDQCPYIDDFFTYGTNWTFREELDLAKTLKTRQYDIAFDFMNNPRSALYTLGSCAERRIAFKSARWWCYNQTIPRQGPEQYIVKDKFRMIEAAGFQIDYNNADKLVLPWFEKDTGPMMKFFSEHPWALDAPLRIAISPTHRRPVRRWPVERYATLADHLTRDWGAFVTWLWGPGEESEIDHIMGLCRESTYKAPKTSFRELAALIGNVDLFIGNSNGPSHVAVAAGTPSLQLHGPTKALSWCPMNDRHWAIQAESMDSIGVTEVVTQLDSLRARLQSYAVDRHDRGVRVNWAQPAPAMPK